MEAGQNRLEAIPPDAEPGMNYISVDFEIVMVNRTNERLYRKPAVALLGHKCYREFEKRDEPCPHCPGRLALATGEAHQTETVGVRDDGTRFAARIRAHPVMGPDNQPTGFIEIVEDITEQKRAESLSGIYADLRAVLPVTQNVHRALRETLDAAFRVEGIDSGCVFVIDQATGEHSLVSEQGVSPECLDAFLALSRGEPSGHYAEVPGMPRALEVVPILHRGDLIATLVVGSSAYPEVPPTLRTGLQSLGTATGYAISRIRAEQSRGDAVADLEALVAANPVATWALDPDNRVTMWNKAAERLFGWAAEEVMGAPVPFEAVPVDEGSGAASPVEPLFTTLLAKSGRPVDIRVSTAPFRDVVGDGSTLILMAQDLTLERRLAVMEQRLADMERRLSESGNALRESRPSDAGDGDDVAAGTASRRVLIVDSDEPWGEQLAGILSDAGYMPMRCASVSETAVILADAEAEDRPFMLAVVDLVPPSGSSGLAQTAVLRGLGLKAPVVVSSDADVRGYERHGIAGVLKRPFEAGTVEQMVRCALSSDD